MRWRSERRRLYSQVDDHRAFRRRTFRLIDVSANRPFLVFAGGYRYFGVREQLGLPARTKALFADRPDGLEQLLVEGVGISRHFALD